MAWVPVAPRGVVFAWERVWHPVMPALADFGPYLVVVVELADADGLRLLGNLLGDPLQDVAIGLPVEGVFEDHDEFTLVQWKVAE
ncbi:OB-fold domain-containing protein [Mycobacterium marseillense]|uniref:OB-fold domain-containing protein n=1 Tax=Mycobacterium marseillense TaxID=701042 RepID=UPI001F4FDC4E|nr:OB-fold domain-containing protein [Mycobacterium marseillense]